MQKSIAKGNVNAVKRFLWMHDGNKAVINARTPNYRSSFLITIAGDTALTYAIKKGQTAIVWLLTQSKDIDVNKCDAEGFTPLMLAAQFGERKIVDVLLSRKDIDLEVVTPSHGNTALFSAYQSHCKDIIDVLLKCGANADHKNNKGLTAAQSAAKTTISIYEPIDFSTRITA